MGAGPITSEAVQPKPPAPAAAPATAAFPPDLLASVSRLRLQFGERQLVALLAKLGSRVGAMDQGGPLRLQVNVMPQSAVEAGARKVHDVELETREKAW